MGSKSIEEQFREQAELIDRLFAYRFEENDKKWDAKLDQRFGELKTDVGALKTDVGALKTDVSALKTDVSALKTDVSGLKIDVNTLTNEMIIVREGVGIILKKLG